MVRYNADNEDFEGLSLKERREMEVRDRAAQKHFDNKKLVEGLIKELNDNEFIFIFQYELERRFKK